MNQGSFLPPKWSGAAVPLIFASVVLSTEAAITETQPAGGQKEKEDLASRLETARQALPAPLDTLVSADGTIMLQFPNFPNFPNFRNIFPNFPNFRNF